MKMWVVVLSWHLTYLGVPLRGNLRAESFWYPVVQHRERLRRALGVTRRGRRRTTSQR